tara:strand:- start:39 stop:509 length:471 start_codon:yes stop_codon:yes gene_type:complete
MTPKELIKMGMEVNKLTKRMTDFIKADVQKMNEHFQTPLTEELNTMLLTLEGEELKKVKAFIRTQIQPLIKTKKTQSDILGNKNKTHKVTIKKVKLTHLKNDMVNDGKLTEPMEGTVRIIFEEKPKPEEKDFFEELEKLMNKYPDITNKDVIKHLS